MGKFTAIGKHNTNPSQKVADDINAEIMAKIMILVTPHENEAV